MSILAPQLYLTRVRAQLELVRTKLYPAGRFSPLAWFEYVAGLLDTAEYFLKRAHEHSRTSRADIDTALFLVVASYNMLDEMEGAHVPQIPFAVVQPLTNWFESIDPNKTFFFRSQNKAEYEIERYPEPMIDALSYRHPSLERARQKIRWPVEFITVPGDAFGTVLHLSLVAHEAGHVAFEHWSSVLYSKVKRLINLTREELLEQALLRLQEGLRNSRASEKRREELIARLPEYVLAWIEETFADAACFFITGPAGFFSLNEMFQMSDWSQSLLHPPPSLRLRLMKSALEDSSPSFASIIERRKPRIWQEWPMEAPIKLGPEATGMSQILLK